MCATRKDSELEWLAKDYLETNPITIKPESVSQVAERFSWVPLPYCSPPGCPFRIKYLALSAHVSPWTIHFWVLDNSPVLGPGRGPPSCNKRRECWELLSLTEHPILLKTNIQCFFYSEGWLSVDWLIPLKGKRTTIWCINFTPGYIPEKKKKQLFENIHTLQCS